MLRRDECLRVLARYRTDEIVVAVYKAAQEWLHIGPHALNYTFTGAMGQGSSHALGLALGRPDKRVIVLDGDGSLLMNLGTLVTIGNQAPKNLLHFVFGNGSYESNGGVPIPVSARFSFAAIAQDAGYRRAVEISDIAGWERQLPGLLAEDGPVLVDLKVEAGEEFPEDFARLYSVEAREKFRAALGAS